MNRSYRRALAAVALAGLATMRGVDARAADDSLAAARDLYAAAAYEDALAVLSRLRPANGPAEGRAIEQYRAFCLLALGRGAEAEHAIETIVVGEPSYHPSAADASPRVRSAFSDVRKRMLPSLIQQQYGQAKAAFDRKEFAAAADGFQRILEILADPDVGAAANAPPLSDVRTLASGFHELSATAAAPPPPPKPPPPPPAPVAAAEPARPAAPRIYTSDDADVVPPTVVRQLLPPFPLTPLMPTQAGQGALGVVIDETGAVESAMMIKPISPPYDRKLLEAAIMWRYRPATLNGNPVKFRRLVQINVVPR
jgi:tetratricopeptide (TPR) repeat protein